jgi:endonuclease YncB( thermonuclease family)
MNVQPLRLAAIILLIATNAALAAKPHYEIAGKVVAIADGDTLTVLDESKTQHKIRLAGIDAPEKGQAFGTKARENLAAKVFRQTVRVEVIDVDRYRREVGRIYIGDHFINMEMVRDGFAWRYVQYDKPGEFKAAEDEAREPAGTVGGRESDSALGVEKDKATIVETASTFLGYSEPAMSESTAKPDPVRWFGRHFAAYTFDYESFNPDGSLLHRGIGVHSGFFLEIGDNWFWVTAGHCLKDELEDPVAKGQLRLLAGSFMDYFGHEATNTISVPFLYEPGCAFYLDKPEMGLDFALLPIDGLMKKTFLANKNVPISRENWVHQHRLDFEKYLLMGIPNSKVSTRSNSTGMTIDVQPYLIEVHQIDPSTVDASSDEWFAAKIDDEVKLKSIKGMSGGPIFGFRRDDEGQLRYHAVAVQSRWLASERIIFGCSLPRFAEQIVKSMQLFARNPMFDPVELGADYRRTLERLEEEPTAQGRAELEAVARRLRTIWSEWYGEDTLHEMTMQNP